MTSYHYSYELWYKRWILKQGEAILIEQRYDTSSWLHDTPIWNSREQLNLTNHFPHARLDQILLECIVTGSSYTVKAKNMIMQDAGTWICRIQIHRYHSFCSCCFVKINCKLKLMHLYLRERSFGASQSWLFCLLGIHSQLLTKAKWSVSSRRIFLCWLFSSFVTAYVFNYWNDRSSKFRHVYTRHVLKTS